MQANSSNDQPTEFIQEKAVQLQRGHKDNSIVYLSKWNNNF